jgi:hypothetical protein
MTRCLDKGHKRKRTALGPRKVPLRIRKSQGVNGVEELSQLQIWQVWLVG